MLFRTCNVKNADPYSVLKSEVNCQKCRARNRWTWNFTLKYFQGIVDYFGMFSSVKLKNNRATD